MVIKRRYRNFRRQQEVNIKRLRRNAAIRVPEVRLVDENDENIGVVPTMEALRRAEVAELDLVEVSPKANPPVCRIMDYGQYEYRQEKLARKAKASQKKIDLKGVRITFRMGE
ncbi:MAG: translation initiation factor IF-3, partial [Candidatus Kerfeldbacteria bacterium]|nr:translation initiation factor IF-3 [Candidatus Kerfeldbacteria bacterium]